MLMTVRHTIAILGLLMLATACTPSAGTPDVEAAPATTDAGAQASAGPDAAPTVPATGTGVSDGMTPPVYRVFRDVIVACDNVRRCAAIAVHDGMPGLALTLIREAGPNAPQVMLLRGPWAEADVEAADLRLDDRAAPSIAALPWRRDTGESAALRIEDPAAIARFIDLVRDGTRLVANDDLELSLSGFNAALLYIDDHQQRLDTPGAWARRGDRPESDVPAAAPLPVLASATPPPALSTAAAADLIRSLRASQASALKAEDCAAPGEAFDVTLQDAAFALDARHALVLLTCDSGAYQASSLVFRAARDGSDVTRLTLPAPALSDDSVNPGDDFGLLVSADFAPATGVLSQYAKGRGIGDCGSQATWQFDGQAFQLSHYAEMQRCGGLASDDWPVLWRVAEPVEMP